MKIKVFISVAIVLLVAVSLLCKPSLAIASTSVNLFQITSDSTQQKDALIYDNLVAYDSMSDIWGFNLDTKTNFPILEKPGQQYLTGFYKNLIVYDDVDDITLTSDVRLYNTISHEDSLIAGGLGSQTGGVTNGKEVVYIDGGACGRLFSYNLKKKTTTLISDTACSPVKVSDDTVVWGYGAPGGTNIYGYDFAKKRKFDVTTEDHFQESPDIFKDKVVWLDYITGAYGDYNAIRLKDLDSRKIKTIYESSTTSLQHPAVSDRYVVWSESSTPNLNGIKAADLKTGEIFEVQAQGSHQNSHTVPSIWKDTAAWMSFRTGNGDIYGADFDRY